MDHTKLITAQQQKLYIPTKIRKDKLHRTNATTWFYKIGVHCVYKLISTYLCEFVSSIVVNIRIMYGLRIIQYLKCS